MVIRCDVKALRRLITNSRSLKSRAFSRIIFDKNERFKTPSDTQYPEFYLNEASVYVHWPYCQKRCHFCNFNKYIETNVNHGRMKECLVKEIETLMKESGIKKVTSVFFGGGTPNLAEPNTIEAVLEAINGRAELITGAEVTMEVNPIVKNSFQLEDFKSVGINRVSVGVQALNNRMLDILGRDHSVQDALDTLKQAKILFPHRTSVDILFGLPDQTLDCWNKILNELIPLLDDHVSVYQLTLERGTKLFKMCQEGHISLPDENILADMYDLALDKLQSSGFYAYEISNFSRYPEACSAHNKAYWFGKQYIGIGPGAHSRFVPKNLSFAKAESLNTMTGMREARVQTLEPIPWMKEVESFGHGTRLRRPQSKREVLGELLSTGLRTAEGVTEENWKTLCSMVPSLSECFRESFKTKWLFDCGLLISTGDSISATHSGWKVLDHIIPHLLDELDRVLIEKCV